MARGLCTSFETVGVINKKKKIRTIANALDRKRSSLFNRDKLPLANTGNIWLVNLAPGVFIMVVYVILV